MNTPPPTSPSREFACPYCGYSLAGLPDATCPECGKAIDPSVYAGLRPRPTALRAAWLVGWPSICIIPTLIVSFLGMVAGGQAASLGALAGILTVALYFSALVMLFVGPTMLARRHLPVLERTKGPISTLRRFGWLAPLLWCVNVFVAAFPLIACGACVILINAP